MLRIGTEIMNQTGDVIGFATTTNQYPNNASFFSSPDRDSLIHSSTRRSPPGGRTSAGATADLSAGVPTPVDASGLVAADDAEGLDLALTMPGQVFVGYVTATVRLTNTGDAPRDVTTRLNLAEGDLGCSGWSLTARSSRSATSSSPAVLGRWWPAAR